ncbi:MAG TPA: MarR family transcriptional regulator [Candidatus Limnocylindrales bacterium]
MDALRHDDVRHRARRRFLEQVGLAFESVHLPRMAGRVLGALLLGPTDGLTAGELTEALGASKGSISSSTRLLEHYGFVDRVVLPADRRDRFAIRPGAWTRVLDERFSLVRSLRDLAEEGLTLLDPGDDPRPLSEVRDMYEFLDDAWPELLARWEQRRRDMQQEGGRP